MSIETRPQKLQVIDTHTFLGKSRRLGIGDTTGYFHAPEFSDTGFLTIPFSAKKNKATLEKVIDDPRFLGMYLMANPNEESEFSSKADKPEEIEMLAGKEFVVGIKSHPALFRIPMDDPRYYPYYDIAQKNKIPFLLHAAGSGQDFNSVAMSKDVLKRFPNLTLILAHFGGLDPKYMDEAVEFATKEDRVYLNTTCMHQIGESRRFDPDTGRRTVTVHPNITEWNERAKNAFFTMCEERPDRILAGTDLGWVPPYEADLWPITLLGQDDPTRKQILVANPITLFSNKMKPIVTT